jgi:hypothetical protein
LSFSFSSKDRKLKVDVLLADMIYNKKLTARFSTRLCTNLLLTNLIKDIPHYINIVLPLTTYSGARSTFIKILVSLGFTARRLMI